MDKHYTKVVLDAAGIPTAPGVTVDARNFTAADVLAEIETPVLLIRCLSSLRAQAPASV